jgi:hypothetical protein
VDVSLDGDDHATIAMGQASMDELGLFSGDNVQVRGRKGKRIFALVQLDASILDSNIKTNSVTASNLRYKYKCIQSLDINCPII